MHLSLEITARTSYLISRCSPSLDFRNCLGLSYFSPLGVFFTLFCFGLEATRLFAAIICSSMFWRQHDDVKRVIFRTSLLNIVQNSQNQKMVIFLLTFCSCQLCAQNSDVFTCLATKRFHSRVTTFCHGCRRKLTSGHVKIMLSRDHIEQLFFPQQKRSVLFRVKLNSVRMFIRRSKNEYLKNV